jgi:hypothetical protein
MYFKSGQTIRLICEFSDFNNNPMNPQLIKVIFYNNRFESFYESSVHPIANKLSEGKFYYDFTIPKDYSTIYYEWHGETNGFTSLNRGELKVKFI